MSGDSLGNSQIKALAFRADRHLVAAAATYPDGYLLVSDMTANKPLIPVRSFQVWTLALSFDGERFAAIIAGTTRFALKVWQLSNFSELPVVSDGLHFGMALALNVDGTKIMAGGRGQNNGISVFDLQKKSELVLEMTGVKSVDFVQIVSAKAELVIGGDDSLGLWSLASGTKLGSWNLKSGTASFSSSGRWYGSFQEDGYLHIVDVSRPGGETIDNSASAVKRATVSDLVLVDYGPEAVWLDGDDLSGGEINYWKRGDLESHPLCSLDGRPMLSRAIVTSSRGTYLATSCRSKSERASLLGGKTPFNEIRVWDTSTMAEVANMSVDDPDSTITAFAFSDDEKSVVFTVHGFDISTGHYFNRVVLQNLEVKNGRQSINVQLADDSFLADVVFTNDDSQVMVLTKGVFLSAGEVQVWDRQTRTFLRVIPIEGGPTTLASSGGLIAIGTQSGTTKLFNAKTQAEMFTLIDAGDRDWLAVNPANLFDGTATAAQSVGWRMAGTRKIVPLDTFFNDYYYPGLITETMLGNHPTAQTGDMASSLGLPGWDLMYQQGLTRLEQRGTKTILCFSEKPTVQTAVSSEDALLRFDPSQLTHDLEDRDCPWQKELPAVAKQYELTTPRSTAATTCTIPTGPMNKNDNSAATLHVLTVALSEYQNSQPPLGYGPLPSSVAGAEKLEQFFRGHKEDLRGSFRDVQVWPHLWNSEATRNTIRDTLTHMAEKVQPNDVIFLFFSGHGIIPAGQEMFYLAPYDWRGSSLREVRNTGLSTAMLADAVRNLPARRIVLIIDSCQSGGALDSLQRVAKIKATIEQLAQGYDSHTSKLSVEQVHPIPDRTQVGVHILASATSLQVATAPSMAEPDLLVTLLLRALMGGDDSKTRIDGIDGTFQYVCEGLVHANRQTPLLVSEGENFAVVK